MSTYFAILTQVGEAKLANAIALGHTLKLKKMGVGDGNGALPIPDRAQKALVHEVRRADLNQLAIDPANASQIIVEQVLPENVGGWWLREIGIYDEAGDLCAVANCPPSYKPVMAEGSARTQVVRVVLIVASTAAIELKIDPSVVLATRQYADEQDSEVRAYADKQLALHLAALDPHPQYSRKEVATLEKFDASKKLVNAAFVQQEQGNIVASGAVSASRSLTGEDIGKCLYFSSDNVLFTLPKPSDLGITTNSGRCIHFFGLAGKVGRLAPGPGASLNADVSGVNGMDVKSGQYITLAAIADSVWQVIDTTAEMWRNADFLTSIASAGVSSCQASPGGIMCQTGTFVASKTGYSMLTFPTAFPNGLLSIQGNVIHGSLGAGSVNFNMDAKTRSGVPVAVVNSSASDYLAYPITYTARGY
ncbi:phage tail protein [Janthinobacterium sp. GW458P]|uniref:phage tail protein n=1 Tax=Janthinobacterium sp. GW458P TaxID=1981504 RepID=UPI000A32366C|nr:phage tail protein [Janthinobacterium sp. GW458P]MBE3023063.1 phage tail protein [Janthinobacterium sp. GW458P]